MPVTRKKQRKDYRNLHLFGFDLDMEPEENLLVHVDDLEEHELDVAVEEKEEFGSQEDESLAQRDVKKGGVAAGDTQFVNEADLDDSLAALEAEEQRLAEQIRLEEKVQKFVIQYSIFK